MKDIQFIQLNDSNHEEILPGFDPAFPYIASRAEMIQYTDPFVPWHWHRTVELFYIESGTLEYSTPKGKWLFPVGSGGMVNSNVLHTSRFQKGNDCNVQLLHLFDPSFLSGERGNKIDTKYILPFTASNVEIVALVPNQPNQKAILQEIQDAFSLSEDTWGYELELRERLTKIWLRISELAQPVIQNGTGKNDDEKIKTLMVYIHKHYHENISVDTLAQCIPMSKRACFRLFQENLHMTPMEYIRSYRLQKACQMLINTQESVTQIAYLCGLGSSSYFGKTFRGEYGLTPSQYRAKWHDSDKFRR